MLRHVRMQLSTLTTSSGVSAQGTPLHAASPDVAAPPIQLYLGDLRWGPHSCLVSALLGPSLRQVMRKFPHRRLPLRLVRRVAIHVVEALQFLEALPCPIIHGDIKPENILVDLSTADRLSRGWYEDEESFPKSSDVKVADNFDKFRVCLADFGCARRLPRDAAAEGIRVGYIQSRWYR